MGKHGPCYHCGVTSTPLWRNGPPEKPVLCNACGSRWRTKGTLINYVPLHARAEGDDYEDHRVQKVKTISLKKRDEKKKKRKHSYENTVVGSSASDYSQEFQKSMDDTSNRSSSGSAASNSESYAQFSADASDLTGGSNVLVRGDMDDIFGFGDGRITCLDKHSSRYRRFGPAQSVVWETQVPSKKRTFVTRSKPTSVEQLTQDLYAILQEQQFSNLSGSYDEELLFENEKPMISVEIGHGSVLMKHPSSLLREEESEASSISVENKLAAVNEAYSKSAPLFQCKDFKGENIVCQGSENFTSGQLVQKDPSNRVNSFYDRGPLLWNHDSPLCNIDLNGVINLEVLLGHLTSEEQQQLLKYLPSSDTSQFPESLRSMFGSSSFKENLSSFQQLLSQGVFSNSSSGVEVEDFRTLKRLAVSNLSKSKWVQLYNKLKDAELMNDSGKHLVALEAKSSLSENLGNTRSYGELNQNTAEMRTTIKAPERVLMKPNPETKATLDNNGSNFSSGSLFGPPTKYQCLTVETHQSEDESTDEELLLDVPCNGFFPQAELLPVPSSASLQ